MHVMFIHPGFPAQFGQAAAYLSLEMGWECTYVTAVDTKHMNLPYARLQYKLGQDQHSQGLQNLKGIGDLMEHMDSIYNCLKKIPQIQPDIVVGHTFFGTMLYLRTLYRCPFVGYFEYLPPPFWSDELGVRPDFPPTEMLRLANATLHTFTYLHSNAVDALYAPTWFQRQQAPLEYQDKIRVIFDGVEAQPLERRTLARPITFRGIRLEPGTRVVTYVSRGLESIRGFDIFMKVAKRICDRMQNVVFLIAGHEKTYYGHELHHLGVPSFKQYVLSEDDYDLDRFHFLGGIPVNDLVTLLWLSDLHIYLTVPYVLSWSLFDAMAAGCTILGSATPPVEEVIDHGQQGLLADFYDVDALTEHALAVLDRPEEFRELGKAARERVLERYDIRRCIPQFADFLRSVRDEYDQKEG